jgi:hypothetical protein
MMICRRTFEAIQQMIDGQSPDIKSKTHDPGLVEQRRPGRREYRMRELIGLPRRHGCSPIPPSAEAIDHGKSQLGTFTGIMVAVGLSLLIWISVGAFFYYVI